MVLFLQMKMHYAASYLIRYLQQITSTALPESGTS